MSILSHCGSEVMNRSQIALLETPAPQGRFHRPIPHIELLETIDRVLDENHLEVLSETVAVNRKNTNLFGVMDVRDANLTEGDFTTSLGFRSSNMQKLPVAFVAGAKVFVCDNLCFFGDWKVLKRKHTINLNLLDEVRHGFDVFLNQARDNLETVNRLKETPLSDAQAKCFVFDSFANGVFPIKCFDDVVKEYWAETPRHLEFAPRSGWSLVNAFTEVAKSLKPNPRSEALVRLGKAQTTLLH